MLAMSFTVSAIFSRIDWSWPMTPPRGWLSRASRRGGGWFRRPNAGGCTRAVGFHPSLPPRDRHRLAAASSRACGRHWFLVVRPRCPACRLDETFERGLGPAVLEARDRERDMHRRLERPVVDPGQRQLSSRGRQQRQAQSGRDEAEAKLRVAYLRYLLPGADGPEQRQHHRPVGDAAQC